MHEARSKDELYRKIYHEPEGNIGVLRVKLMCSLLFFERRIIKMEIKWKRGAYDILCDMMRYTAQLIESTHRLKEMTSILLDSYSEDSSYTLKLVKAFKNLRDHDFEKTIMRMPELEDSFWKELIKKLEQ